MVRTCVWAALPPFLIVACDDPAICLPEEFAAVTVHALSAADSTPVLNARGEVRNGSFADSLVRGPELLRRGRGSAWDLRGASGAPAAGVLCSGRRWRPDSRRSSSRVVRSPHLRGAARTPGGGLAVAHTSV
jgi:hypothetical protein